MGGNMDYKKKNKKAFNHLKVKCDFSLIFLISIEVST